MFLGKLLNICVVKDSELRLFFKFFLCPFSKLSTFTQIKSLISSHHFITLNTNDSSKINIPSPDLSAYIPTNIFKCLINISPRYFKIASNHIENWTHNPPSFPNSLSQRVQIYTQYYQISSWRSLIWDFKTLKIFINEKM